MGSLSVSTHRRLFHWQGLLLIVSLLTFWSLPTTAQLGILSVRVPEGDDVVLRILNKPPEAVGIVWYKGKGEDQNNITAFYMNTPSLQLSGPKNKGEEMITDDGSLLLKNITQQDTGMYTVVVHLPDSKKEMAFGQVDVYGIDGSGEKRSSSRIIKTSPWSPSGNRMLSITGVKSLNQQFC